MVSKLIPLAQQLGVNSWLFDSALKDVAAENVSTRPDAKGNSLLWNAGHATTSRCFLANLIGVDVKHSFGDLFDRGHKVGDDIKYPSIDEIKAAYADISGKLMARLDSISEEELSAEHDIPFPIDDKTLAGAVTFMSLHDSYHMGQLSYTRKLLGLDGLTG